MTKEKPDRFNRAWTWKQGQYTVFRSIARTGPGCHNGCGVLLFVRDGRLEKVEGDPDFPFNQGRLCPRCLALPQVVYHPSRLKHPLRRKGRRGEGRWEIISWEEAFRSTFRSLGEIRDRNGAESVVFCHGTARDIGPYVAKLAYSFGSPNRICFGPLDGHACFAPRRATFTATAGGMLVADCAQFFEDRYDNRLWSLPECILIWGNNPIVSNPDGFLGHWIVECMKRGSKIVVIDPRRTWLATRGEIWMQIRPGTDGALALGMLNVIINENLFDKDFVLNWTHGFEQLRERVERYDPKKVSKITWVPERSIVEAARLYATSKPAAIQLGVAVEQTKECIPVLHAIAALCAVTGNIDVPGGNVFKGRSFGYETYLSMNFFPISPDRKRIKIGSGIYPLLEDPYYPHAVGSTLVEQIETGIPYPIKAAWIQGTNTFACVTANPRRVYEAMRKLDFVVVVDLFMTPTATAFADIVLPATTYVERDGIATTGGNVSYIGVTNKAIEPVGESKSDAEIVLQLGRMFNPGAWPWESLIEMFDFMLKPVGVSFEELRGLGYLYDTFEYRKHEKGLLRPDGKPGFNTPTGKIELFSTVFGKFGLDPLPYYEEPPESPVSTPDVANDYPLVLTTGARTWGSFHSEHRQVPLLRHLNPAPITEIHPETAERFGIEDGDWIYIETKYGRCEQKAKITDSIHPDVIQSQHGWWFPEMAEAEPELSGTWVANINLVLPSGWVGRSGFGYPFKALLCRVRRKEQD